MEAIHRFVLGVYLSRHQNIIVTQAFIKSLVKRYGKHVVYSDGGTWYPDACAALGLEHRLHSPCEKSLMERANQYLKDRVEEFDYLFLCRREGCDLAHVRNWHYLFMDMHYARRRHIRIGELVRFLGGDAA